jgi:hypothetical protein
MLAMDGDLTGATGAFQILKSEIGRLRLSLRALAKRPGAKRRKT